MLRIPKLLLIGSTAKDSGKTTFIVNLIEKFIIDNPGTPIYGVKSTVLREKNTTSGFIVSEELNSNKDKDTSKMLAAGCKQVFWLRCDEDHAEQGIKKILEMIPVDSFIICESNTIRNFVEPDCFLMVVKKEENEWKKTAKQVKDKVDLFINSCMSGSEILYNPSILKKTINNKLNWMISDD